MWGCLLAEWGLPPIFPLPKCGSLPSSGDFPRVSVRTITLLAPPPKNPYQITYSLMMLLIKLCCLVSPFLMSHIGLIKPSVRFIVIINEILIVGYLLWG